MDRTISLDFTSTPNSTYNLNFYSDENLTNEIFSVSGVTGIYNYSGITNDYNGYVYVKINCSDQGCKEQIYSIKIVPDQIKLSSYTQTQNSIIVYPCGGISPYTYNWVASDGGDLIGQNGTSEIIDLIAGTYSVTITDCYGDTFTTGFTINNSTPTPTPTFTPTVTPTLTPTLTPTITPTQGVYNLTLSYNVYSTSFTLFADYPVPLKVEIPNSVSVTGYSGGTTCLTSNSVASASLTGGLLVLNQNDTVISQAPTVSTPNPWPTNPTLNYSFDSTSISLSIDNGNTTPYSDGDTIFIGGVQYIFHINNTCTSVSGGGSTPGPQVTYVGNTTVSASPNSSGSNPATGTTTGTITVNYGVVTFKITAQNIFDYSNTAYGEFNVGVQTISVGPFSGQGLQTSANGITLSSGTYNYTLTAVGTLGGGATSGAIVVNLVTA